MNIVSIWSHNGERRLGHYPGAYVYTTNEGIFIFDASLPMNSWRTKRYVDLASPQPNWIARYNLHAVIVQEEVQQESVADEHS